ncbi:S1 family peptidase [Streptomyces sp. NPDC002851]
MQRTKTLSGRRTVPLALGSALALLPVTLATVPASADGPPARAVVAGTPAPGDGVRANDEVHRTASDLARELGDRSAGSYLDAKTGELVVTVTSESDATKVRTAGARAEKVTYSGAELKGAIAALKKRAQTPGTSWGIDPRRNQVVVEADRTVSAAELDRVKKVAAGQRAAGQRDAVHVRRVAGTFRPEVSGGDAVYGGEIRCSVAFNVASGSTRYFLTAGHCTNDAAEWRTNPDGPEIGQRTGSSFPTNDYGIVKHTDGSNPYGNVNLYNGNHQDITSAADPVVGQAVKKSGSATKVTSGSVTQTNVTVNYGNGNIVHGMVKTNVCSAGGDSGGAYFAGSTALGIHSGSAGDCNNGVGSALFQPVKEALGAYGVNVY